LTDPSFAQRFDLEATTAAALDHPNIVKIYSRGSEGGLHYLVMQHLSGGSLQQRLAQAGRLPALDESARMIGQVAGALDYAHRQGVIHRDIKTSNIMFDGHGNAILVDFGIAKLAEQALELTRTGMAVGTPIYMAPEQSLGIALTPAADQYALGIVAYILVTGRVPYEAPTPFAIQQKKLTEPLTPPQMYRAELPPALKDVLERVLAPQPEARYTTASDFALALSAAASSFPESPSQFFSFPIRTETSRTPTPSAPPPPPTDTGVTELVSTPPPMSRGGGRLPLIAVAAVVALRRQRRPQRCRSLAA
jgi:serine/threonine protein kinase